MAIKLVRSEEELRKIWIEYKRTADEDLRNVLLETYLPLVKYTAERVRTKLPDEVELDDLSSAGIFGLMDAVDGFDPDRGVKFETYCSQRIRGAILDHLRNLDWLPRLARARAHRVEEARQHLEIQLGRAPSELELAEALRVNVQELHRIQREAVSGTHISLSKKWYETDSQREIREIDILVDEDSADPITDLQRKDLKELVVKGLSRNERLIVVLYYYEEMTMKEIGRVLNLSESRVSQMHSAIVGRLKGLLQTRRLEFPA
jgi:RNA polymerase sigma factor for flagellar operon FliA